MRNFGVEVLVCKLIASFGFGNGKSRRIHLSKLFQLRKPMHNSTAFEQFSKQCTAQYNRM